MTDPEDWQGAPAAAPVSPGSLGLNFGAWPNPRMHEQDGHYEETLYNG